MEKNYAREINEYYNELMSQTQLRINRQSLKQIQDLANCIKILGNALSFAENYAIMNGYKKNKPEFTYYDYYNASQNTEKSLYFKKLSALVNNLNNVYDYYVSIYRNEPLPRSIPKEDIIRRLKEYKECLDSNEQIIYDDFINIFNHKPINNVKNFISTFKGDGTMDPNKIKKTFLNAGQIAKEDNEYIEEKYTNDPNYYPDIKMNKKEPCIGKDYNKYL